MESKHEASSVILNLMGLDKVPSQHHPVRDRQKVLSEDYFQKVASIGVRKKRSSHHHGSLEMSTDEKEGTEDVLIVVEKLKRRDKNHYPSKGNGKENLSLFRSKVEDVPPKTTMKSEQGNLLLRKKMNNRSQIDVHGKDGLYETFRLSKFELDRKDANFDSRISVSKPNPKKERNGKIKSNIRDPKKERNGKIKSNIRGKAGFGYSFSRTVPTTKYLADNRGTMIKDDLFQKYWGLRKNVSANRSSEKSEDMIDTKNFNKLKKRYCRNDLFEREPMLSQLSSPDPSAFVDSKILQQTCLMNEDVKNNEYKDMFKKSFFSLDSSLDFLVSDVKTKVVGCSDNNPTTKQSESTTSVIMHEDRDSLSHASKQQETLEFHEDSIYSSGSGADADSVGNFHEEYEPSPISVLDSTFSEDISVISVGVYDSSEMDDEELDLNVSSDEDCEKESIGNFEEKKGIVGLSGTEESRDFSYVVEVLTEAGISNASLFKDYSTWHSAECPISPSVFETLEKKFGKQQLWKRSERRLLFDRINLGLLHILHPYLYIPMWETPLSRRLNTELRQDMIEDEMWGLLVSQEKKAGKESVDDMLGGEIRWIELSEDVEDIVREVVKMSIEEIIDDIVKLENFLKL